ncbi:sensor domain-containing diguanylate cyclase [Paenibacillus methanolicus]|uniref:Diguanylate cyclase (GGDEF)-like protein n=1 Tax=Paenibacillus methanolicus TaxID=582686 RepID=A0A5S5CKJ4_9BACL|nr:sensor domain-containing diguanylate cyclase [Paenibacillus methanolicus]TYP79245.1 diguanylate cyclase (GGDEF)-like protein [Paenibacillus methanolicus]
MAITVHELNLYNNFEEMANDILQLANEFMPDKLIFLSAMTQTHQLILKVLDDNSGSRIEEGMSVALTGTVCRRVNFAQQRPLIYPDMSKEPCLDEVRDTLREARINSYVGVPIVMPTGDVFGTLCAVHPESAAFDDRSVRMFQRIAKMFSYYLDLERMAFRDALTGLYNRQYLFKYFDEQTPAQGAVFFLDLDGFKKVNDLRGHEMGDLVLKEVAHRIQSYMANIEGFAARLGGDEFIIHFSGLTEPEQLGLHAETLIRELSAWNIHLDEFRISTSIGIATYHGEDDKDLKLLIKNADNALYRAKAKGKKTYQYF